MLVTVLILGIIGNIAAVSAATLVSIRAETAVVLGFPQWTILALACVAGEIASLVVGFLPFWLSEKVFSEPGGGASFVSIAWIIGGPIMCFVALPLIYAAVTMPNFSGKIRYVVPPVLLLSTGVALISDSATGTPRSNELVELLCYAVTFVAVWIGFVVAVDSVALGFARRQRRNQST